MKILTKLILVIFVVTLVSGPVVIYVEIQNQSVSRAYNQIRPKVIRGGGKQCLSELSERGIKFTSLGDVQEGNCLIKNAVRVASLPETELSGALTLNCRTASSFISWVDEIEAKNIVHMGTYNCRKMRGSPLMSEHSFGTAIDIASINGSSVKLHWKEKSDRGDYIRETARIACDYFSNSITPDHNALHHDHLHLDSGYGTTCLPTFVQQPAKLAINFLERFR